MTQTERLDDLLIRQAVLDELIITTKGLKLTPHESFLSRSLALAVETSELANEIRSFKFWSNKPMSEKSVLLDEYVDIMHFLLSLTNQTHKLAGLSQEYRFSCIPNNELAMTINLTSFNELLLVMHSVASELYFAYTSKDYQSMLDELETGWVVMSTLGEMLGFTDEDIDLGYQKKYIVNMERLSSGY